MRIRPEMVAMAAAPLPETPYVLPRPMPGMVPTGGMAMDDAFSGMNAYAAGGVACEGLGFLGYPYLAELSQRPEYRQISETIAREMTRKWVSLHAPGGVDKADKIAELTEDMRTFRVQALFRRAAEIDGFMGRAHLFFDFGNPDPGELRTPLSLKAAKVRKGTLKRIAIVEPVWTYPATYNSSDPLAANFYRPESWYVMGKEVHGSRLPAFVGREMPDMLKPAYMFGGLSYSQMAKPYVDHWIRTRDSVSDMVHAFSVMVLSTDMNSTLTGGVDPSVLARADMFNRFRDNRGLMMINKDSEELANISAPLGGLDKLLAQAQEQMCSVSGQPLVVQLGITPSGLNASSEGELRVWNDRVASAQEHLFRDPLQQVINILQLNRYGEIDPDIDVRFVPLWQMSETELATIRKTNADVSQIYVTEGVISPAEERKRLAEEEGSPWGGLDLNAEIETPDLSDNDPSRGQKFEDLDAA